ncbi:unnamed protein product [Orchesella dallaii]|uniref:Uncharacterized protein n=1 Tax=Orchesella dallaii TaxID=48710 RepID=A0ABP1QNK4_9HEXA
MALLACKYVSEIVLDAPIDLNESLFDALSINCVVPSIDDYGDCGFVHKEQFDDRGNLINDRYWVAKKRGIFHEIHLDQGHVADMRAGVTISKILSRVHKNWKAYAYAAEAGMNSKSESCVDHDANKKEIKELESVTLVQTDCEPELTSSIENGCGNCGCGETLAFQ